MAQTRGNFPFPYAQSQEGYSAITLGTGGTWYLPSGEWLCTIPANMALQWWNPLSNAWQSITSASDFISSDGTNLRLLNTTGIVQVASFTAGSTGTNGIGSAGSGVVAFSASNTTGGVQATGYVIVGGTVAAPTITQAGSGFLVPPLVICDPPPIGGIQATAVAALSATGTITSVTIVNAGAGYATIPNWFVIPQPAYYTGGPSGGVAAAAGSPPPGLVFPTNAVPGNQNTSPVGVQLTGTALTGSGTVTGVVMINNGSGYTGTPTGTITGVGAATVTMSAVTAAANATAAFQPRVQ
jgi:hypothetical protein